MQAWLDKITLAINLFLGSPANPIEFWVLLGSSSLLGMVALHKAASAVGARRPELGWAIASFILGMIVLLVGVVAMGKFVIPQLSPEIARWGLPGSIALISFVIIMPLLCLVHRMNYLSSVIVWVVCLMAVGIIIALGGAGFEMAQGVKKDSGAVRERSQATREFLDLLGQ